MIYSLFFFFYLDQCPTSMIQAKKLILVVRELLCLRLCLSLSLIPESDICVHTKKVFRSLQFCKLNCRTDCSSKNYAGKFREKSFENSLS